jgi:hypothetical protein
MPVAAKKWFKQTEELSTDLAKKLSTSSFGMGVMDTLESLEWDGKSVAAVGLELTPDNRRVKRSQFLLLGALSREPVGLAANKLFPDADPAITMMITIPEGSTFRFNGGSMSSDLLPCESYKIFFAKAGNIIFPTEWAANKVGETSMRAICHLDKASNSGTGPKPKTTILLFPRSAEEMNLLSDGTQSPAWPGIRILQVTGEFFPKLPSWKDPICPLLLLGSLYHDAPHLPSLADIKFHIAATMRSARLPTACTSGVSLARQWSKALADIEKLEKEPTITWPDAERPAIPAGKLIIKIKYRYSFPYSTSPEWRVNPILISSISFHHLYSVTSIPNMAA